MCVCVCYHTLVIKTSRRISAAVTTWHMDYINRTDRRPAHSPRRPTVS